MKIELTNQSGYIVCEETVKSLVEQVREKEPEIPENLSIVFVDAEAIAELNRKYYRRDGETDVLAFDYENNFAEIILNPSRLEKQAKRLGHSVGYEAGAVLIHGLLHLAGYDHTEPGGEPEHFRRQRELGEKLITGELLEAGEEKQ